MTSILNAVSNTLSNGFSSMSIQGQDHKVAKDAISSDMTADLTEFFDTKTNSKALLVKGSEDLTYGFRFTRDVFAPEQTILSEFYKKWGRALVVMDGPVTAVSLSWSL
jgi:hypothetical protein